MIGPGVPGASMEAFSQDFDCGLVGTLGVTIDDGNGNNVLPRTTANIIEIECVDNSAVYRYLGTFPTDPSLSPYVITWDDGLGLATEEILVSADAPAPVTTTGPCQNWIEGADVANCCDVEVDSDTIDGLESAAELASAVLYELSGQVFSGLCGPITVRPCRTGCGCWPWPVQNIAYAGGGSRLIDIGWFWNGMAWDGGYGSCGCGCTPRVLLSGYPVQGVTQVKINGEVLSPSVYRVDEYRYLTRTDGDMWPMCQDLALEDDQEGTWSVSYYYGATPGVSAIAAAEALACEIYNACNDGECKLPEGAIRMVRAGVTIDRLAPLASMLERGDTGIIALDSFLVRWGGYRRRPAIWSPDGPKYARPVG